MELRPQDVVGARQRSEPALVQMESLPSAPPLPAGHTHIPTHAAFSSQVLTGDWSQPVPYPALHESAPVGSSLRQNSQREERSSHRRGYATGAEGGTPGGEHTVTGDARADADSADEQPPGSLAWAMQAAAGASSAAASVLSAWIPWGQQNSSSHSDAPQQQGIQQTGSAAPGTAPTSGR